MGVLGVVNIGVVTKQRISWHLKNWRYSGEVKTEGISWKKDEYFRFSESTTTIFSLQSCFISFDCIPVYLNFISRNECTFIELTLDDTEKRQEHQINVIFIRVVVLSPSSSRGSSFFLQPWFCEGKFMVFASFSLNLMDSPSWSRDLWSRSFSAAYDVMLRDNISAFEESHRA